jgi:hypothetical protein
VTGFKLFREIFFIKIKRNLYFKIEHLLRNCQILSFFQSGRCRQTKEEGTGSSCNMGKAGYVQIAAV